MKIQAITNNSFKGLFTDKSKQNNNEWLMEYRPYSWELEKYSAKPKMALKEHLNLYSIKLPDNEEIYTKETATEPALSKDILGTVSYYKYPDNIMYGKMRSTITVAEPMNREDSLRVYLKKMETFRTQKEQEQRNLAYISTYAIEDNYNDFLKYSDKYDGSVFNRRPEKDGMVRSTRGLYESARNLFEQASNYIKMTTSLKETDEVIKQIKSELTMIEQAKENGNIIDVSVRTGDDPDMPLKNYLADKKYEDLLNSNALLILPTAAILLKNIVSNLNYFAGYLKNKPKLYNERLVSEIRANMALMIK